jgi:hypothetical protein
MYRLLIGSVLFLCACGTGEKDTAGHQPFIRVEKPLSLPDSFYRSPSFTEPFFSSLHYSDLPEGNTDTLSFTHTAELFFAERTGRFYLKNCIAILTPGSLLLTLRQSTDTSSFSPFEFHIARKGKQYFTQLDLKYTVADSAWHKPVYTVLDQHILLDKERYEPGDSLKGKVDVRMEGLHTAFDKEYRDTFRIQGLLKTKIKAD